MKLVILFSKGGLGDVGRHAVRAALERPTEIEHITVLSQHSESLNDDNWNCGCDSSLHKFSDDEKQRLSIVHVESWSDTTLASHFEGAGAVISCLGNRQMTLGDRVGGEGSAVVVKAMNLHKIRRAIVISSIGVGDDWPPLEFSWAGKIMACIFLTCGRSDYKDLTLVESTFQDSQNIDYLFVRPAGLAEDVVPKGHWYVQKEKHKDKSMSILLAKLDCARFMVEEAINPTRSKTAAVVGSPLPNA
ncbi:NAD(P)H-binding protein [Fragilaria crotonensis]|nr:NAD(P)H-binding protein [Fragilaria crotonensis]